LGPSPTHAWNVYLVLNLITGCVSLQYHCRFDDFFETTRHGGQDVSGTICWQQSAGLSHTNQILSEFVQPTQSSTVQNEMLSEIAQVVPSVSSMQRKRNLTTNKITKHKARLNLHGGKQVFGMNYFKTYAPVVTWFAVRLVIVMGIIFNWALHQVDLVMAYPQAPVERDIYMELPQGIQTETGNSKDHVLKLLNKNYGQKQAGRVWNSFLMDKLTSLGYTASLINDFVFFRGDIIFMVYVDDGIFLGNDDAQLQQAITEIQGLGLNIKDQGHPADYVRVTIKKL
jgi:hypothetical protein